MIPDDDDDDDPYNDFIQTTFSLRDVLVRIYMHKYIASQSQAFFS